MKFTSEDWRKKLGLTPHPEGGFYKEVYRSDETIKPDALPERYGGERNFSTSIYYLLNENDFSAFHRLKSDEIWHFYYGNPLILYIFYPPSIDGKIFEQKLLGAEIENGTEPQILIPRGSIFAACVSGEDKNGYSLIGCTVAPGFDFADFEICKRKRMIEIYPEYKGLIKSLTR
ncbi:MAG: cupin domain-containing protein [Chlorobi bacterium]|nr:cupin domain-containing protein [Chlorobiota bacterium]